MGRMSELNMQIEESRNIIEKLDVELNSLDIHSGVIHNFQNLFRTLKQILLKEDTGIDFLIEVVDFIFVDIKPIIDKIISKDIPQNEIENYLVDKLNNLDKKFSTKTLLFQDYIQTKHNSDSYYNNEIQKLKKELKQSITQSKLDVEKRIKEARLEKLEKEFELKRKQDDAKLEWETKITDAFENLKSYINPIVKEKSRLNALYWIYLLSSGGLVLLVIVLECIAIHKITSQSGYPDFKQYMTLFLPLPVVGALMWGFIFQMNRAQRQLVALSKSIHSIEYVQGLMLSINQLAPSIEDSIRRVNEALDRLIDNHLSEKEKDHEAIITKEEDKDKLPLDAIIKILKEAKGLAK